MTSELVINVQPQDVSIAITEDKLLMEFHKEEKNVSFSVGNIYLGRVKKIMPGLNACFVDVGSGKEAFLHYLDLGSQFYSLQKYLKQITSDRKKHFPISKAAILPEKQKEGNISDALETGQEILVQITKEPISTKGPRLTCELSFAGRFLILIPFEDKVSVSSKIKSPEERTRLKQLLQSIKPKNFGIIVRTVAEGKRVAELDSELRSLIAAWDAMVAKTQKATKPPTLVHEESNRTTALLRDLFNPSYENIYVNDESTYNKIPSDTFRDCEKLEFIDIPDPVESINSFVFDNCSSLTWIAFGNRVTEIAVSFKGCDALKSVFYRGTPEQFAKINYFHKDYTLDFAKIYYFSESEPLNKDNGIDYWHYDGNGYPEIY